MVGKLSLVAFLCHVFIVLESGPFVSAFPHAHENKSCQTSTTRPLAARQVNEILYRRNIFNKDELEIIRKDITTNLRRLKPETSSSVAHGRRGLVLPSNSHTVQVFEKGSLLDWVVQVTGNRCFQLKHQRVPVELRSYDQSGAGMAWHSDDVLFAPEPQLEIVFTLENTSDCQTLYKSPNGRIESVQTEVNSVLLVPAGGPEHCVTSLQRGRRIIVKAVYALEDCRYLEEARVQQFKATKAKKGRRR